MIKKYLYRKGMRWMSKKSDAKTAKTFVEAAKKEAKKTGAKLIGIRKA